MLGLGLPMSAAGYAPDPFGACAAATIKDWRNWLAHALVEMYVDASRGPTIGTISLIALGFA